MRDYGRFGEWSIDTEKMCATFSVKLKVDDDESVNCFDMLQSGLLCFSWDEKTTAEIVRAKQKWQSKLVYTIAYGDGNRSLCSVYNYEILISHEKEGMVFAKTSTLGSPTDFDFVMSDSQFGAFSDLTEHVDEYAATGDKAKLAENLDNVLFWHHKDREQERVFWANIYAANAQSSKLHQSKRVMDSDISAMNGQEFEQLVLNLVREMGFDATGTKASGDGGIDIVAYNNQPLTKGIYIIQCKRQAAKVGEPVIRDLYGVVTHERANKGILITTSDYTAQAYSFAEGKPLELVDGKQLLQLLSNFNLHTPMGLS